MSTNLPANWVIDQSRHTRAELAADGIVVATGQRRRMAGLLERIDHVRSRADLDADGYAAAWALNYYLINNHTQAYFDHLREVRRRYGRLH